MSSCSYLKSGLQSLRLGSRGERKEEEEEEEEEEEKKKK